MYLARVTFGQHNECDDAELVDAVEWYLSALTKNGQITNDNLSSWSNGSFVAYVSIAGPNSYAERYHTPGGKACLKKVIELFGKNPEWATLDDKLPKRAVTWRSATSLFLYTSALDELSPVSRGDNGKPIPLYLLPFAPKDYKSEAIYFWANAYRHHEYVWLGTSTLEIPAYKEIAEPGSQLSQDGRRLCRDIEAVTGKPTYYYLFRYWGISDREDDRLCPGCGEKWRNTSVVDAEKMPFWQFHFRCEPCRLVSHQAISYDNKRASRIGTFRA